MTKRELYEFLRRHEYAVQASVSVDGAPQAAVVGIVTTDRLELFFDTLNTTRKWKNLQTDGRIAFVIGWDEEQTVQYEGIADEPAGPDLERLKGLYFKGFPDGRERERWPGITYFRVRPRWIRYSDFRTGPTIVEFTAADLDDGSAV